MPALSSAQRLDLAAGPDPAPPEPIRICGICNLPGSHRRGVRRYPDGSLAHSRCRPRVKRDRSKERRRDNRGLPKSLTFARKHFGRLTEHLGLEPLTLDDRLALLERPLTWGECRGKVGPCPWAGCVAHRYLDAKPNGAIVLNYPDLESPLDLEHPCVLRIAERREFTLEETGVNMNLTRERVRQVEMQALRKLKGKLRGAL